jgi:hypothetical protein
MNASRRAIPVFLSQFCSRSVAYNSGSDDSVAAAAATVKVTARSLRHYSRVFTSNGPQTFGIHTFLNLQCSFTFHHDAQSTMK